MFTHYTPQGASRLDRIYINHNLTPRKLGVETVVAAFTDHLALLLRLSLDPPYRHIEEVAGGEISFQLLLQNHWKRWKAHKKYYPNSVLWWERYVLCTTHATNIVHTRSDGESARPGGPRKLLLRGNLQHPAYYDEPCCESHSLETPEGKHHSPTPL